MSAAAGDAALRAALSEDLGAIGVGQGALSFKEGVLAYAALLARWNAKIRLVGPMEPAAILREQIVDALGFALALDDLPDDAFWDIGAGGGLPGILLALRYPERRFVLVEPIHKKTAFLATATRELGLGNVVVHTGRVDRNGSVAPAIRVPGFEPPRAALSRATLVPELWLDTARRLVGAGGLALIALADEVPAAITADPGSTAAGAWRWRVPATGAPRTLVARRISG